MGRNSVRPSILISGVRPSVPYHSFSETDHGISLIFGPAIAFGGSYVTSSVCLSATQDLILPTTRFWTPDASRSVSYKTTLVIILYLLLVIHFSQKRL